MAASVTPANLACLALNSLYSRAAGLLTRARRTSHLYALRASGPLLLDLYRAPSPEPSPVALWFHGGGWRVGSRRTVEPGVLALTQRGYAVACVSYRLSHQATWPAPAYDAKAAVRWLRANGAGLGLETSRLVVIGASAGGHLASIVGATSGTDALREPGLPEDAPSSDVCGVVAYYPAVDPLGPAHLGALHRRLSDAVWGRMLGGRPSDAPGRARSADPRTYLTRSPVPFLVLHGAADGIVAPAESESLCDALRAAGGVVERHVLRGLVHADPRFNAAAHMAPVHSFLDAVTR